MSGFGQSNGEPFGEIEDLGAGLGERFDDLRAPDVLADRHAEAHAADVEGARHRPGREDALFVEHAVVRQVVS